VVGCSRNEEAQPFVKRRNENESYRRSIELYQGAKASPQLHADYLNVKQRYSPGLASSGLPPSAATPSHILPAFSQQMQQSVDIGLLTF